MNVNAKTTANAISVHNMVSLMPVGLGLLMLPVGMVVISIAIYNMSDSQDSLMSCIIGAGVSLFLSGSYMILAHQVNDQRIKDNPVTVLVKYKRVANTCYGSKSMRCSEDFVFTLYHPPSQKVYDDGNFSYYDFRRFNEGDSITYVPSAGIYSMLSAK